LFLMRYRWFESISLQRRVVANPTYSLGVRGWRSLPRSIVSRPSASVTLRRNREIELGEARERLPATGRYTCMKASSGRQSTSV
jgi:hypothetical protein